MGSQVTLTILDRSAPRRAADPLVADVAAELRDLAAAGTPRDTGRLAAGYQVVRVKDGTYRVVNPVEHAVYVEYGTRHQPANPALGRALAQLRPRYER